MWTRTPSRLPPEPEDLRLHPGAIVSAGLKTVRKGLPAGLLAIIALAGAAADEVPQSREQITLSFAPIVRQTAPAVVNIYTTKRSARSPLAQLSRDPFFELFFGDLRERAPRGPAQNSLGSGVVVRDDGLIVTNHHVIEGADEIMVVLSDRRELQAAILGDDEDADLALLRVDAGDESLPVLPMGDSDGLEVGDLVLAIGNPFGIGKTVTSGIVSALGRTTAGIGSDRSFIQTDAAINPGNSGGALVTLDGRLVGINSAIFTQSGGSIGIGFAIPVNLVKALIRAVEGGGDQLVRPWLGARMQQVDPELAATLGLERPTGVVVSQVHPKGPAARAGLAQGDVVLAVDGNEVIDPRGVNFRLAVDQMGDEARLDVWRGGKRLSVGLALETPPYDPAPQPTTLTGKHALSGATVANMSPGLNEEWGFDLFRDGVVVIGIQRGSDAARLRFRTGDVIMRLAGREIESVDLLARLVREQSRPWQLEVDRGGRLLQVVIN